MRIFSNNKLEKRISIPYTHDIEDFKFIGVLLDALEILLGVTSKSWTFGASSPEGFFIFQLILRF